MGRPGNSHTEETAMLDLQPRRQAEELLAYGSGATEEPPSSRSVRGRGAPWLWISALTLTCLFAVVLACLVQLPQMWPYYLGLGIPGLGLPVLMALVWRHQL
jgi:hypothetical protein